MITTEEIELARTYTARLTEDDKALLFVKLDPKGDLRIFQAGDDESIDSLLQKPFRGQHLLSERGMQR